MMEDLNGLAVVLQCGGLGTRLGVPGPKSLYLLPGRETPLSLILEDTPENIPIYIHMLQSQKPLFRRYLGKEFPEREVRYLVQNKTPLSDRKGIPIVHEGRRIMVSDGPATFGDKLQNAPPYLLITDGCKLGLDFFEVEEAFGRIKKSKADAIVFARKLSDEEIEKEVARMRDPNGRPTYSRINCSLGSIMVPPALDSHTVVDPKSLAITGHYLVRTERYAEESQTAERSSAFIGNVMNKYSGYAMQLRTEKVFKKLPWNVRGLSFEVYESHTDKFGLKYAEDIERWREKNPERNRANRGGRIALDFEPPLLSTRMEDYCG